MGLNKTPSGNRIHIGIFGKRNSGKSSLINAMTGQDLAVVSEFSGTTTDPVYKAMELSPIGPVMLIDTPGIDDVGCLGEMRVKKALQVLNKSDIALLVVDAVCKMDKSDKELVALFNSKDIPFIIAYNKCDLTECKGNINDNEIFVSAKCNINIDELKLLISKSAKTNQSDRRIIADLLQPLDFVVLVTPIDKSAPKGRLILPQQQTIREILDSNATAIVVQDHDLKDTLSKIAASPRLVVTDSQVFDTVHKLVPDSIPLTSFSILFARYKGLLENAVLGAIELDKLKHGDTILISEGCTHHRQCEDIGTVKLPNWIREYTTCNLNFEHTSGVDYPQDLQRYRLIVHCGGCMLNEREIKHRQNIAQKQNVPITNYGTAIAHMQGILQRSVAIFPEISKVFNN